MPLKTWTPSALVPRKRPEVVVARLGTHGSYGAGDTGAAARDAAHMSLIDSRTGPVLDDVAAASAHGLGDLLRRSARRMPAKPALIDGARRLSFAELDIVVDRTANALLERGIRHGDRVAVLTRNRLEMPVLTFALARIGAVMVPVNFMLNGTEVGCILRNSGAVGLVVQDALHDVAAAALGHAEAGTVRLLGWIGAEDASPPD